MYDEKFIGWVELNEMPFDRVTEGVAAHATGFARVFIDTEEGYEDTLAIVPTFEDDYAPYPKEDEEIVGEDTIMEWWYGETEATDNDYV